MNQTPEDIEQRKQESLLNARVMHLAFLGKSCADAYRNKAPKLPRFKFTRE